MISRALTRATYRWPYLNRAHPLWRDCVFAGVGPKIGGGYYLYDMMDQANGNHGTLTNMDPGTDWVWVPELGWWGLALDRSGGQVDVTGISLANAATLSFWLNPSDSSTSIVLGDKDDDASFVYVADGVRFRVRDSIGGTTDYTADTSFANRWRHYCLRWDGTGWELFLDAVSQGTGSDATVGGMTINCLGDGYNSGNLYSFAGSMSDVIVWNGRGLSNNEIRILANKSDQSLGGAIRR